MQRYRDIDNDSGVTEFETGDDYIRVKFEDGGVYLYNYFRPGQLHVDEMKRLAARGDGLNAYITKRVGRNYARKER